jgi:hypothetical protein
MTGLDGDIVEDEGEGRAPLYIHGW